MSPVARGRRSGPDTPRSPPDPPRAPRAMSGRAGPRTVEHADVTVLGDDAGARRVHAREELLLELDRAGRPRAHLRLGRRPPSVRTRAATEGSSSRTTKRCAVEIALRTPSTPCQPASSIEVTAGASCARAPATPSSAASTIAAAARLRGRGGIGIELEVARVRDRVDVTGRGGDHRGIVRAVARAARSARRGARRGGRSSPRPRRRRRCARARPLRRLSRSPGERADDRALVRRGEVGAPALGLLLSELASRVEQRCLEPREREVEAGDARDGERERSGSPLPRQPSISAPPG